ncbi:ran-binding protein in the microtubule-organising centre protein [Wolffia australiana]
MGSCSVNWEALDSLAMNFAESENLVEDRPSSPSSSSAFSTASSSSSCFRVRLVVRQVRSALEEGNVDDAIDLLRRHAPAVLDDHRLLFRLQKQKFIELLRKGTARDRQSAIECLQKSLAPCALDAYPEAYEEFKHALLALIYDKEDDTSPVSDEWSKERRLETAAMMSSVLRGHLQAYDPVLSMTLRYLISIHKIHCFRHGIQSPISEHIHRLLVEDRDPPGIPQESLYDACSFDEVDIQALAHAVELTRQGAIDSLRFARGDLNVALQNELCRMKLNLPMLDELIHEYCIYRGLVDEDQTSGDSAKSLLWPKEGPSASKDCSSLTVDHETSNNVMSRGGEELTLTSDAMDYSETCSTSHINDSSSSFQRFRKIRKHGFLQQRKLRRWKERTEMLNEALKTPQDPYENDGAVVEEASVLHSSAEIPVEKENKYAIMLELKKLARKGMTAEVVDELNSMDPDFFLLHPALLFQLKQAEFFKCVSDGDHDAALRIAYSYLGPLASKIPDLLQPLKETLFVLLKPNEDAMPKCLPFSSIAASLQVALGQRFGIEEPLLIKIMRTLLNSHKEWFKLQMCSDHFEGFLKIDCLKNVDCSSSRPKLESDADNSTFGSTFFTSSGNQIIDDSGSPVSVSSDNTLCSENAILKVMEFLALPRAEAIHLLLPYNGNAETVIQQMFQ